MLISPQLRVLARVICWWLRAMAEFEGSLLSGYNLAGSTILYSSLVR